MGHVYKSRFKNCLIQRDEHLKWVLRYVERNPLRAGIVKRAQDWQWSSLYARLHGPPEVRQLLSDWPIEMPHDWTAQVNRTQTPAEEAEIQLCVRRGRPLGDERWVKRTAERYDLQTTLRERGRQAGWRKKKGGEAG